MAQALSARELRIRQTLDYIRQATTDKSDQVVAFEPTEFTDPVIAERERELVFGRVPSIVCHSSELPSAGCFLTLQMPRNRVIVVRQRDGGVKAFVNMCRHRGALLEGNERGRCRLFSCGYHRWSYDTDGSLRSVTHERTFGEIDRQSHGLIELSAEERHGFVWLIDGADAQIDVAKWLGPEADEMLSGYGLGALVVFRSEGFDEPVNWKVMQDAFIDNYHIQYAHPNSAAKHVHTNVQVVEDFGRHARMMTPRKTIDRYLQEDPGSNSLARHVIDGHFLLPNSTLLRQPDHFQLLTFRPHPKEPGRCRMEMRLLVPTVADSGMGEERWTAIWDKNWRILLEVLHEEDLPLLRSAQLALESANGGPLLLGRNEIVNHIFRRELRKLTS